MRIVLNGEEREIPQAATVADLLRELGLAGEACAVEVNRTIVPRSSHPDTGLAEGDRVEIVRPVAGGRGT